MRPTRALFLGPLCFWVRFQEEDWRGFTIVIEWRTGGLPESLPRFKEWYIRFGYNRSNP